MFLLLIPSITALVVGFSVMGDGGNCVIWGASRIISIECGVDPNALFVSGVALPEPLVSWGLVLLGAAVTAWVAAHYWVRFRPPVAATPLSRSTAAPGLTIRCPFCAEVIQSQAIVCRWCGRDLPEGAVAAPPAAPAPPEDSTGIPAPILVVRTVTEPGATLRDAPAGGTVTHLSPGTRVAASERSGAWVSVVAAGGVSGWVRESELIRVRTPAVAPRRAPVVVSQAYPRHTWRVSEPGVSLMNSPDGTALVARLTPGTKVVEVESMGRHIKVTAPNGRTGWVDRRAVF